MFVGREMELRFLEDKYKEQKAQLIVMYGRRRIGKTETLHQFCKNKAHVFYTCTEVDDELQLNAFSREMMKENIPARNYISHFSDWKSAFLSIADLPYGDEKKMIVIDEFPYACISNTSIPSILQSVWDTTLKDKNVMIILCGSSLSFMERELLGEKNPLYGRATGIFKMKEMDFYDAMKFFPSYSAKDKVITYSILGGVPHYLSQFDPSVTLEDNIKRHILSKGAVLYNETDFLLHQELRQVQVYNAIIAAIASGCTKLNEISQKSMINNTAKTSTYLRNLLELGIIEREFSIDAGKKEKGNSMRGIYKLRDQYFRFWYRFVFENMSALEDGDIEGVYHYLIAPQLSRFASLAFEEVSIQFTKQLQMHNKLPFRYARIGRWMGKTTIRDTHVDSHTRIAETEIDILAISQDETKYLVGECKFKDTPFSYTEYLETIAKLSEQKKHAEFYYTLYSASGFDERLLKMEDDHLLLFDLEEIVNPAVGV